MPKYVATGLIFLAAVTAGTGIFRRRMSVKLYEAVMKKDKTRCGQILNNPLCRIAFSGYEYLSFHISTAIKLGCREMLEECCKRQKAVLMKKDHRESILFRLAACYVDWNDREKVEEMMEELRILGSQKSLKIIDRLYHIYILKDDVYLKRTEQEFQAAETPMQKRELASYLAEMHENSGDTAAAQKYLDYIKKSREENERC